MQPETELENGRESHMRSPSEKQQGSESACQINALHHSEPRGLKCKPKAKQASLTSMERYATLNKANDGSQDGAHREQKQS